MNNADLQKRKESAIARGQGIMNITRRHMNIRGDVTLAIDRKMIKIKEAFG
jgi:hypothetical protein